MRHVGERRRPLWVIRDRVELAAGPAMSAMLRKRKQNQSIGICRDGPGFRVKRVLDLGFTQGVLDSATLW
jgi:hypothetical protein